MSRLLFFLCVVSLACAKEPVALYLTWIHDPTTTMTIQWHLPKTTPVSHLAYQKDGEGEWHRIESSAVPLPHSDDLVHTAELTDLSPASRYRFRIDEEPDLFTFRTLSADPNAPLRFVIGGDVYYYRSVTEKMNRQVAKLSPDFVVLGGDIAYTTRSHRSFFHGPDWEIKRWQAFLNIWRKQMVSAEGDLIPFLAVIGNHDIYLPKTGPGGTKNRSVPIPFNDLFATPRKGVTYRTLDIRSQLSLFFLDTGHEYPIEDKQTEWLAHALGARAQTPYKLAVYHIAAYPSVYPPDGSTATRIRTHWVPLFESYGLQAAFENHNHAFKITHPLKQGKPHPQGVLYLGDGAWGVSPRRPIQQGAPYLARSAQINHVWLVTLSPSQCRLQAIDIQGNPIDHRIFSPASR